MQQQYIHLGLEICTILLGLYLAFFKSYFQEKGKNLATEQDIQKITILVEEAKKQFSQDIEFLRNRLSLYAQNFNSIKTLERNALIDINKGIIIKKPQQKEFSTFEPNADVKDLYKPDLLMLEQYASPST